MIAIDAAWLAANPLPSPDAHGDKDARGRVLVAGGSAGVSGAIALTGEAALRVGAGKVKLATVARAAIPLGVGFPEAAVVALPEADGEVAAAAGAELAGLASRVDALVVGPGMGDRDAAAALVRAVATADAPATLLLLDAAAVAGAAPLAPVLAPWRGRLVMTPHAGEAAALLDREEAEVAADQAGAAAAAARRFGAVVAVKGRATVIAAPDGTLLRYPGGGPGLGTGGSGDVLAGVIAGLLARGIAPLAATGWGVWLHGEAGRRLAAEAGPLGFLARELLPKLPGLLPRR